MPRSRGSFPSRGGTLTVTYLDLISERGNLGLPGIKGFLSSPAVHHGLRRHHHWRTRDRDREREWERKNRERDKETFSLHYLHSCFVKGYISEACNFCFSPVYFFSSRLAVHVPRTAIDHQREGFMRSNFTITVIRFKVAPVSCFFFPPLLLPLEQLFPSFPSHTELLLSEQVKDKLIYHLRFTYNYL